MTSSSLYNNVVISCSREWIAWVANVEPHNVSHSDMQQLQKILTTDSVITDRIEEIIDDVLNPAGATTATLTEQYETWNVINVLSNNVIAQYNACSEMDAYNQYLKYIYDDYDDELVFAGDVENMIEIHKDYAHGSDEEVRCVPDND